MSMSWKKAIERVLREAGRPMHYSEISEQVLSRGYYKTDGATPDATVNAEISVSIRYGGDKNPFVRIGKGIYGLLDQSMFVEDETSQLGHASSATMIEKPAAAAAKEPESDDSIIRCLGMYWQRDLVVWRNEPKVYGKQQSLSKPVNFGGQRGIYILYDHHTVVYVGRSVDRPLGKRLFEHTSDRLGSRWTRFSWFGLMDVTDEGLLIECGQRDERDECDHGGERAGAAARFGRQKQWFGSGRAGAERVVRRGADPLRRRPRRAARRGGRADGPQRRRQVDDAEGVDGPPRAAQRPHPLPRPRRFARTAARRRTARPRLRPRGSARVRRPHGAREPRGGSTAGAHCGTTGRRRRCGPPSGSSASSPISGRCPTGPARA